MKELAAAWRIETTPPLRRTTPPLPQSLFPRFARSLNVNIAAPHNTLANVCVDSFEFVIPTAIDIDFEERAIANATSRAGVLQLKRN